MDKVFALLFIAGLVNSAPFLVTDAPITGPTLEPIECNALDKCAVFGGFRTGTFRLSRQPKVMVQCTGTEAVYCTRCPADLYYSEKCGACMYYEDESKNVCHTTQAYEIITLPPYNKNFCSEPPQDGKHMGNLPAPDSHFYYACVATSTYYMPCPSNTQFNSTCNICT